MGENALKNETLAIFPLASPLRKKIVTMPMLLIGEVLGGSSGLSGVKHDDGRGG